MQDSLQQTGNVPTLQKPKTLERIELTENALTVLKKRYLIKDDDGNPVETVEDMLWRVAYTIAEAEKKSVPVDENGIILLAQDFYKMMARREFVPNSPTLMNAGRPLGQLSACFVLPVADSLSNGKDGIYDTLRAMALVHQSGGGTGFAFSNIRPKGDIVRSTMGVASGPVSFMTLYDSSTDVVKQGGTRRGANMGILRVDHPDIREFITCKSDTSKITNFNISVAITDEFMEAVRLEKYYSLIHPTTKAVTGTEYAPEIFEMIIEGAWQTGEPGVFFIDRANEYNPVPQLGEYEATNPCGEQPLLPYDVCNLGSINLSEFFRPMSTTENKNWRDWIDWNRLSAVTMLSVHFLDNVIDANLYPLQDITDLAQRIRRIGLGIMGFADLLVRLGIRYDSEKGLEVAEAIMEFINESALAASASLAYEKGSFQEWPQSIWGFDESCARDADGNRIREERVLRNCNITTIAPTGTISMIAGCSSGIEPLFAVAFMRNQADTLMPEVNKDFESLAQRTGWYSKELMERIAQEGHIHFDEVPKEVQDVFRTSHDITPEWHVRMQAAFQKHIDSAISKTTNFPNSATREDVREIYVLAYTLGCKGVTVYRDGSRPAQVLSTGRTENQEAEAPVPVVKEILTTQKRTRPNRLFGTTIKKHSPLGTIYVTVNEDSEGQPFEVFCTVGKAGGAAMADAEAIGRLISLSLRSGISIEDVFHQLRGISCDNTIGMGPNKVLSAPDAIAQAIGEYIDDEKVTVVDPPNNTALLYCEECDTSGALVFEEGCYKCHICGVSKCG